MKVEQIYPLVNQAVAESIGKADLLQQDLSNLVDVGNEIFDANAVDHFTKKLINHIGKVVFVNRKYAGRAPSIQMSGWEFGSILEKIDAGEPDAEANPHWQLTDGEVYEQNKFIAPKNVTAKFYNDRVTFQVPFSLAEDLLKQSFSNVEQMNAFVSMLYTKIENQFTLSLDALTMDTVNNFAAAVYAGTNKAQAVNLLDSYKKVKPDTTTTAATALYDPEFIRHAAYMFKVMSHRMTNMTTIFNAGGRRRFTPTDLQKIIMLDVFADAADIYLQSDTFHDEFTRLPNADKVSFWQGTGKAFDWDDVTAINVKVKGTGGSAQEVAVTGVLGVIFDHDALGINNYNRRATSHYNAPGEFLNYWYKMDAQYFNDYNEQFVLFYVEDAAAARSSK